MSWLVENPLLIWAAGAVALTMAIIVYVQTGTRAAQIGILAVVLITAAFLVAERLIETPREAVARTLNEIADAVRDNDMPTVLNFVSPSAVTLRQATTTVMSLVNIERASILGTPKIEVDLAASPAEAQVECRGFVFGTLKQNGMKGPQTAQVKLTLVRVGDRWLITDFSADKDWRHATGS